MKLAVNPETVNFKEIEELADDELVTDIVEILKLHELKKPLLKAALQEMYDEFLSSYYEVRDALPEHEEKQHLSEVRESAWQLLKALNNLLEKGNTDQRLAEKLSEYHEKQIELHKAFGDKDYFFDKRNPNYNLRRTIGHIVAASKQAMDELYHPETAETLRAKLNAERNEEKRKELETEIIFAEFVDETTPNRHEEYKQRVAARRTPKDLPLRTSIELLRAFFDDHVEFPFTAGKYYPEIGFKSPAFYAVKIAIKKIYPEVSDRKIASLMQEAPLSKGYNFSN